jgi:hypothetical protein
MPALHTQPALRRSISAAAAALALCFLAACETQEPNENCDGMPTGIEQDVCMGKRLKDTPASEIEVAIERANKIRDPMVKGEAISSWVEAHANAIPPNQGQKLCSMLEGRDGAYCLRRLSSPHLQE